MDKERQQTLERISTLKPNQRWALQVFTYVQQKRMIGGRIDDLNMDVITGMPEKFLDSDVSLGIVTMAGETTQVTHLGFIEKNGKLVEISTPAERWNAVQRQFWHEVWGARTTFGYILRPFFEAHLAERPDIKLHLPNDNEFPEDIYFAAWHPEHIKKEDIKDAFNELEALNIIQREWYRGGAERCHFGLNPTFFQAFREGLEESSTRIFSWKDDPETIKHALYYLGPQPDGVDKK